MAEAFAAFAFSKQGSLKLPFNIATSCAALNLRHRGVAKAFAAVAFLKQGS
ncbi:hypothetical protein [Pontibacter actiniarum]|uniref:hypothetical protein n=1 Tax=Pontibacter actiniarum TaxID=323450 RepID=UPI0013C438B4|nr:hypothetical protein [Pontibacter actiniarum]